MTAVKAAATAALRRGCGSMAGTSEGQPHRKFYAPVVRLRVEAAAGAAAERVNRRGLAEERRCHIADGLAGVEVIDHVAGISRDRQIEPVLAAAAAVAEHAEIGRASCRERV